MDSTPQIVHQPLTTIVLCELHNKHLHGFIEGVSSPDIKEHYLCHYVFRKEYINHNYDQHHYDNAIQDELESESESESESDSDDENENENDNLTIHSSQEVLKIFNTFTKKQQKNYIKDVYFNGCRDRPPILTHDFIRNYKYIISNKTYFKPEIATVISLPKGCESVAILKTFWIRCIQRCWKKLVAQRKQILTMRKHINNIHIRTTTGKWPEQYRHWPEVKGMFW
mgnify:FL=1|jgi:hypothetical protein|tara:strand:- start:3521 stop:4198 length:678 start_codon:yes stop_codon:yes gene_type:complete